MRYLGGKTRNACEIAETVNAGRGDRLFWEPFCGGLSVSVQLAKHGPGIVSDASEPLIALYRAVRAGWAPPISIGPETYQAARALPDSDPLKAFCGFGCSFGGKWFGGMARGEGRDYAAEAWRGIVRDCGRLDGCAIERLDFLAIEPQPFPIVIYADPPYAGTEPYASAPPFDSARFWARIQAWERVGVPCFVSEYACPVPHRIVWEKVHSLQVAGGQRMGARLERLFRVLP